MLEHYLSFSTLFLCHREKKKKEKREIEHTVRGHWGEAHSTVTIGDVTNTTRSPDFVLSDIFKNEKLDGDGSE